MHIYELNDENGDLAEVIPFCSDTCHREWCAKSRFRHKYQGWNGAHEGGDANAYCANCGVIASCGEEACEHQRENTLVNRFHRTVGEQCEHGNWIQLPWKMMKMGEYR
jgi:hypothetical protein